MIKNPNDLKSTIVGVVMGVASLMSNFGIIIPQEFKEILIIASGMVLSFYVNKED